MFISLNGKIIDSHQACVPMTSKAYLYGHAAFESLRTYNGKIFRLQDHLKRLFVSAEKMMLQPTVTLQQLEENILWAMGKFDEPGEAKLRIILTEKDHAVMIEVLEEKPEWMYNEGVKCIFYQGHRNLPEVKRLADIISFIAKSKVTEVGAYEAILIDQTGHAREGAYANLFWVVQGQLHTTNCDILFGITRQVVLEMAPDCQFSEITPAELLNADEIFLTQSTSGILPVVQIDGHQIGNGKPAQMTKKLLKRFKEYI